MPDVMTDPQVKEKLLTYLTQLEKGGDFVLAQAPELVREILAYHYWCSFSVIALAVITIVLCVGVVVVLFKYTEPVDTAGFMGTAIGVAIGACFAIMLNVGTFVKCSIAPRYFIVQELAELLNKFR